MVRTVTSQQVRGSNPGRGLSWSWHVYPEYRGTPGKYSGLIGGSKLPVGVLVRVCGCLSTCGPDG